MTSNVVFLSKMHCESTLLPHSCSYSNHLYQNVPSELMLSNVTPMSECSTAKGPTNVRSTSANPPLRGTIKNILFLSVVIAIIVRPLCKIYVGMCIKNDFLGKIFAYMEKKYYLCGRI